jgi:hypothetical protein
MFQVTCSKERDKDVENIEMAYEDIEDSSG